MDKYVRKVGKWDVPMEVMIGPKARAREPMARKMPMTIPFSPTEPHDDTTVVRHGTITADAEKI